MTEEKLNYNLAYQEMISNSNRLETIEDVLVNRYKKRFNYTEEEIKTIILNGSLFEKRKLSRSFFSRSNFYRRVILHYATLLRYSGIVIPAAAYGKKLEEEHMKKKYFKAVEFIDRAGISNLFSSIAADALINGCYYGVLKKNKKSFTIMDLPVEYCRTRFKDEDNNDIAEFNVAYFDTLTNKTYKRRVLEAYPIEIQQYYADFTNNRGVSKWVLIPSEIGVCFPFLDKSPAFLSVIPSVIDYENSVEVEKEREIEEIKKIIALKVPHNGGEYLLEPTEAEEIHSGVVKMMNKNKNVSVLTTFTDVESLVSKSTTSDVNSNALEKMKENIYSQAGTSSQLFASTGNLTLESSVKNDISFIMLLVGKFETYLTNLLNRNFGNSNITFKYKILEVGEHNQSKFLEDSLKLATLGYSFIIPAVSMGISQSDLIGLKQLENDIINLEELLVPLSSAFNQSGGQGLAKKPGAPAKDPEQKAQKTIKNEESLNKQGGAS